jgi:hypothetical protein
MRIIKISVLLAISLLLVACSAFKVAPAQTVYKTVVTVPPPDMYCAQTIPVPVDPNTYADSSVDEREKMLFELLTSHQTSAGACLNRNRVLKEWFDDQVKIHNR